MKTLNKDSKTRDGILGLDAARGFGGIKRFEGATFDTLRDLERRNFLHAEEAHNGAPSIGEIMAFLYRHPDFTAHGYAVDPERDDYRISLEGVSLDRKPSFEELSDFARAFRHADDFRIAEDGLFCWFD